MQDLFSDGDDLDLDVAAYERDVSVLFLKDFPIIIYFYSSSRRTDLITDPMISPILLIYLR